MSQLASAQLRSVVERIERLEEEAKTINSDKSDIYKEARSNGFDVKALKEVVRLRRKDPAEREEHETLVDLYKHALGMLPDTAPEGLTRARVETIEESPPHDEETGEIIEDQGATQAAGVPATVAVNTAPAGRAADESPAPIQASADLTIPTFLQRGHAACVVKA